MIKYLVDKQYYVSFSIHFNKYINYNLHIIGSNLYIYDVISKKRLR